MKRLWVFILCALPLVAADVIKDSLYKALGFGVGYYHYGEVDEVGDFVMRKDEAMFRILGNLGYITHGFKIDAAVDANFSLGLYTGGILTSSNPDEVGKRAYSIAASSFYHGEIRLGYNLLNLFSVQNATLYLQTGSGYRFYREGFMSIVRHQGYLYVPIELEGEVRLKENIGLNYMLGYNYFVFGDHKTLATHWHYTGDLIVKQQKGFGIKSFIGVSFKNKEDSINTLRLVYEFWSVGASPPSQILSSTINVNQTNMRLYEPENVTHTISVQYLYNF